MSTRAIIAVGTQRHWEGVYHHWDGYPSGLGKTLFDYAKWIGQLGIKQLLLENSNGFSSLASKRTYKSYEKPTSSISSWETIDWLYVVDKDCLWIYCCWCRVWRNVKFDEDFDDRVWKMCTHVV
jgi:hypothetical protein